MSADDLTPSRRSERSHASQRHGGMDAARRIWAGPLGPYLMKHGALAALVTLAWVGVSWIAVLISFVVVVTSKILIRAHFIRRYGKSGDPQESK